MTTYTRKRSTYKATFDLARRLSPRDQRRLLAELAKLAGVKFVLPNKTARAIRTGRNLANQIRMELQSTKTQPVEETVHQLRGRSWS